MDSRAQELIKQGDKLFGNRLSLLSLWQEAADNFYVERADFTVSRSIGRDFAEHLTTSIPMLARREFANTFGMMMRPSNKEWAFMTLGYEDNLDNDSRKWLERSTKIQRAAMYDKNSLFVRATKEADNDFVTFGQAVISVELNQQRDGLLYRTWHLRDVAWCEGLNGKVDTIHRKWKPTILELSRYFGEKKLHSKVVADIAKDPYKTIECRHIVVPIDSYDAVYDKKKFKQPYVSIYIDVENQHVIEEVPSWNLKYVIPRWQTVSGSQYAFSPCTVAALPEARLIQSIALTLLEAGEKAVNPPLIGVGEAIRSDISQRAGGFTSVDAEYDERLGEVLRPLNIDKSGLSFGMEMRNDTREIIQEAFFLNKLNLPPAGGPGMTAYETGQRIQEYIRTALPLFEPAEQDYNAALCELTFDEMFKAGGFGPLEEIPQALRGKDISFKFESPLTQAIGKDKGQRWLEAQGLLAQAIQSDPSTRYIMNNREAIRDVFKGLGTPAAWLNSEQDVEAAINSEKEQQEVAQTLAGIQAGATAAKTVGEAGQALAGIGGVQGAV